MKNVILLILTLLLSCTVFAQRDPAVPLEPMIPDAAAHEEFRFLEEEMKKNELQYLKQLSKELAAQLQSIKELDKERYYELLRDSYYSRMGHLFVSNSEEKQLIEQEAKINEMEMKTEILSLKYLKDSKSDKQKIEKEIQSLLSQLFDLKEEQRKDNIRRIEMELVELKKSIEVRKRNKEDIIKGRLRELLGQREYLDWD